jgi:NADH dehydrogenase
MAAASEAVAEVAAPVADAVTAASGDAVAAVADTATKTFAKVWDLTKPIFDFNGPISTWFRTTFMDGMAAYLPFQFFQLMVVFAEIGIGLALFGGLFTWWAAAASIVMCVVFTLSGMFAWDQLWFVFAGFLMLGGAGRAFGLDCWVVPFCKKWWNGTKIARRNHWYLDGPAK